MYISIVDLNAPCSKMYFIRSATNTMYRGWQQVQTVKLLALLNQRCNVDTVISIIHGFTAGVFTKEKWWCKNHIQYIQNIRSHTNDLDLDGGISNKPRLMQLADRLPGLAQQFPAAQVIGKYMGKSTSIMSIIEWIILKMNLSHLRYGSGMLFQHHPPVLRTITNTCRPAMISSPLSALWFRRKTVILWTLTIATDRGY